MKFIVSITTLLLLLCPIILICYAAKESRVTIPCQSGSAVKIGIPWPDSDEPLSSLEYTIDGIAKTVVPLDGRQAVVDNDGGVMASKRLFQNVLRSSDIVSETRSNCKRTSVQCPDGKSIGFGFTTQFSSDDRTSTLALINSNNKACPTGAASCETTPCLGNAKKSLEMNSQTLKSTATISATTLDTSNKFRKEWISNIENAVLNLTQGGSYCSDIAIDNEDGSKTMERYCCPHGQRVEPGSKGLKCVGGNLPVCYLVKKAAQVSSGLSCSGNNIAPIFEAKDDGTCTWKPVATGSTQNMIMGERDSSRSNRCPIYFKYDPSKPSASRNVSRNNIHIY